MFCVFLWLYLDEAINEGEIKMTLSNETKKFYETTGKNIKKYRDLRNYSLQVLAEKVGLTKKTIQRYENGEIKINMDRLRDLADALDVKVINLTEGTNAFVIGEERAEYSSSTVDSEELHGEAKLLAELKNIAEERQLDLSDPKTLDLFKDALDLIKRVRGE